MSETDWLSGSIAAKRGLAGGATGRTHVVTEADQGTFHYTYGPHVAPKLRIAPGDTIVAETQDAFGGAVKTEQDMPSEKTNHPYLNPQTGPFYVEGARKGDCLAVHIRSVETRGPQPAGTTALIPEFGGLVSTAATATLNKPLPEIVRTCVIDAAGVHWGDMILPYEPFIGTIGVSPQIEAISSLQPDYHGGNDLQLAGRGAALDLRGIRVGVATRIRSLALAGPCVSRSSAETAIWSNGTRTVVTGVPRRLTIGMSL